MVDTKVQPPGFASEDTREDREGFHGTPQPRGRRKPTLLEDLLWVPPCSAGQDPSALYRAASRSDAVVVLGFRRKGGPGSGAQISLPAHAESVDAHGSDPGAWTPRGRPRQRARCRQGDRQAGQHQIAKSNRRRDARCRGRSLSASVDPYSNDFCVRGMAATGLVRSVRSVMVAQCSSRARRVAEQESRIDGRISRREVSSAVVSTADVTRRRAAPQQPEPTEPMCSGRAASMLSRGEAAIFWGRRRTYRDGRSSRSRCGRRLRRHRI